MGFWIQIVGLGLCLAGGLIVGLADAWLSQSLLMYIDAVEANVTTLVQGSQPGGTHRKLTEIDLKRDWRLDRARGLKTLGWLVLALGFGLQLAALWLTRGVS